MEELLFEEIRANKEHYRNAMQNAESEGYRNYFSGNLYAYESIELLLNKLLDMSRQELLQRKEKIDSAEDFREWERSLFIG